MSKIKEIKEKLHKFIKREISIDDYRNLDISASVFHEQLLSLYDKMAEAKPDESVEAIEDQLYGIIYAAHQVIGRYYVMGAEQEELHKFTNSFLRKVKIIIDLLGTRPLSQEEIYKSSPFQIKE